jgi:AraC family transcriptional regulator
MLDARMAKPLTRARIGGPPKKYRSTHGVDWVVAPRNGNEAGRFFGQSVDTRRDADLLLVDSRHPAGSHLPRHAHERAYFCLNHGGMYGEAYGRRRRVCHPGMVVFHPPGETHSEIHHTAVASLNVELGASWLQRLADAGRTLDSPAEREDVDTTQAASLLLAELGRRDPDSTLTIESLTWEILFALGGEPAATRMAPRWLRSARDLLDGHFDEPVSLRGLAHQAGVHPVHFAAAFRRFHGCSVGEYLRRRRLQYARRRLADPEVPLALVAAEAGFADQSHLTRTFKRFTGMTPGRYRTFLLFKTR